MEICDALDLRVCAAGPGRSPWTSCAPTGGGSPPLVNAVLERDPHGDPVVVRAAIFDSTERRRYKSELVRADERRR
jgi:hypothetical protein